jgi:ribosome-associated translation inhibitor RaiA
VVLRDKGVYPARVLTAGGELALSRRYFWAHGQGGTYPVDEALGIADGRVSPGAREVLCRMGMVEDFDGAAEDAQRIGNVPVCKERLRQIVEAEGAKVTQVRNDGTLPAAWSQADAQVEGTDQTRIYGGIDGVMAPMVTQVEKDKRRKDQVIRRQKRVQQGLKNAKPLPPKNAGHDEKYREMKIGVFYDQGKTRRHTFATAKRWQGFAQLLGVYAGQVDFAKAGEALTLTDGAKWILSAICLVLSYVKATLLDYYHLSQHVHLAAKACLGETPAARAWAQARLAEIKEQGVPPVLRAIAELNKKVRSPAKKKQLRLLRDYLLKRLEMLDYKGAQAQGWDIGSGPTEAMCKNLTLRLKRTGMKWDAPNAEAMMNLTALYESGQKTSYWSMRKAA